MWGPATATTAVTTLRPQTPPLPPSFVVSPLGLSPLSLAASPRSPSSPSCTPVGPLTLHPCHLTTSPSHAAAGVVVVAAVLATWWAWKWGTTKDMVNTHRQCDGCHLLTHPLHVGSDRVWVHNTPVARVGPVRRGSARACQRLHPMSQWVPYAMGSVRWQGGVCVTLRSMAHCASRTHGQPKILQGPTCAGSGDRALLCHPVDDGKNNIESRPTKSAGRNEQWRAKYAC
jgi:hypothetical protein